DGGEDQRALAGSGNTGEHRQPALGDLDAEVLQVVLPGALHPDQVVTVSGPHSSQRSPRSGGPEAGAVHPGQLWHLEPFPAGELRPGGQPPYRIQQLPPTLLGRDQVRRPRGRTRDQLVRGSATVYTE